MKKRFTEQQIIGFLKEACAVRVCGETSGNRGRSCRFPGVGLKGLC
ncbi:hypothetical protein [Burkholderia mallei]|nr:hypothetical protein [Burkholderia mallei]